MNYGFQPYGYNPYGQFNTNNNFQYTQPQYNGMNNTTQTLSQQTQVISNSNQNSLQGWYVDGYDVTKSINADMNGNAMFFPSTDGNEIYKKQLDISTGKSFTYVYKLDNSEDESKNNIDFSPIYDQIDKIKSELLKEISEVKEVFLDAVTTPSKKVGGR